MRTHWHQFFVLLVGLNLNLSFLSLQRMVGAVVIGDAVVGAAVVGAAVVGESVAKHSGFLHNSGQ
jgi:hypothetical protein